MSQWCYPLLPWSNYSVQPGCGFLDPGYYQATINPRTGLGSVHPGCDFNGLSGGNTDLGDPIYAAATGRVIHAQSHRVWGNIIMIEHPADGVWTMYAHCNEMLVQVGQPVRCGDKIGTIGRGGKNAQGQYYYLAHLHFEVRRELLPADEWPSTTMHRAQAEAYIARTRHDPLVFLAAHGAATTLAAARQGAVLVPTEVKVQPAQAGGLPSYWKPLLNPETGKASGEYISIQKNVATGELAYFKVPAYKLAEKVNHA